MSWKININGTFFITIIFILAIVILTSVMFIDDEEYSDLFMASAGVLELSPDDLEHNIPLTGEWDYFSDVFLEPSDVSKMPERVTFPHFWQTTGIGTYRLKIKGLNPKEVYSLYIHDMVSAYKLFVDDQLLAQSGVIGSSLETEVIDWKTLVADFSSESDEVVITIQLSNHHYFPSGLWREVQIGKHDNIVNKRERNIMGQMLMFGGILMIGVYNFSLFVLNRKERSALYFSLFNFAVAFKILFSGERIINLLINDPDWIILTKIQFVLGYLMLGLFMLFCISCLKRN